jgi:hypothetical protein
MIRTRSGTMGTTWTRSWTVSELHVDPSGIKFLLDQSGPTIAVQGSSGAGSSTAQDPISSATSFPDDLDLRNVPPDMKKEGSDWFVEFNPKVKKALDVRLVHALNHKKCKSRLCHSSVNCGHSYRSFSCTAVLCAVCDSLPTGSSWPLDAIAPRRYMTPQRVL